MDIILPASLQIGNIPPLNPLKNLFLAYCFAAGVPAVRRKAAASRKEIGLTDSTRGYLLFLLIFNFLQDDFIHRN